jgi:hypothetical protein
MPSHAQPEHSLALADVLEQELQEICGEAVPPPLPWTFEPAQVLRPLELRTRLLARTDAAARGLAEAELRQLAESLKGIDDADAARTLLAEGFNQLLAREDFYKEGAPRFAAVRFRSCTRERIHDGPVHERNRLILEDAFPELQSRDDVRLARAFAKAHQRGLAALCLSGGGIRSAAFALGVVQGLARLGVLGRFHYLSTVSGGGYLGAWLSAWVRRAGRERVQAELTEHTGRPLAPEPAPLSHIRSYSSYLSPRLGATSIDTWTLAAIYLRNLALNWLVLVPLLTAALSLPQLLLALTRLPYRGTLQLSMPVDAAAATLLALSALCAIAAARYVHANRPVPNAGERGAVVDDPKRDQRAFIAGCLAPAVCAVVSLTFAWAWIAADKVSLLWLPGGRQHGSSASRLAAGASACRLPGYGPARVRSPTFSDGCSPADGCRAGSSCSCWRPARWPASRRAGCFTGSRPRRRRKPSIGWSSTPGMYPSRYLRCSPSRSSSDTPTSVPRAAFRSTRCSSGTHATVPGS